MYKECVKTVFTTNAETDQTMCNAATKTRICAECGQAYTTKRTETFYCGPKCAAAFNNRMKSRGANAR